MQPSAVLPHYHPATGSTLMLIAGTALAVTLALSPVPTQEQVVTEHNLYTHHCHEDEAQVVTPFGLACVPLDNITDLTTEQFDGLRVVTTEYEYARP